MKRILFYVVLVFSIFFLQTGIFTRLAAGGIEPNLLVISTVSIGILRGKKEGCLIGFAFGLMMDSLFGLYFGLYALILAVLGYISGYLQKIIYEEDMTLPILMIGLGDIVYSLAIFVLTFLVRGRMALPVYFVHIILPEVIYTLALSIIIYRVISAVNTGLERSR